MKWISVLALITCVSSCGTLYQVAEVASTNVPINKEKIYVFENDSIRISYSFWSDKGQLEYSIYNKLDKPIYVDWKKSSYIKNGTKNDYWKDAEIGSSVSVSKAEYVNGNVQGASKTSSASVKLERITFIAPKSNYTQSMFSIGRKNGVTFSDTVSPIMLERIDKKGKFTKGKRELFSEQESPISFRVFLTLSTKENFEKEFYIDNGFYVSKITEMTGKQFATSDEYESPYYRQCRYYTFIKTE